MASAATQLAHVASRVFYQDYRAKEWFERCAPCRWRGAVRLRFREVEFQTIEPAGSRKHPEVVAMWEDRLHRGKPIPPLVVCATPRHTWYLYDGNHRHEALRDYLHSKLAPIRVAVLEPERGFAFLYRTFGDYGTYVLEPRSETVLSPVPAAAGATILL